MEPHIWVAVVHGTLIRYRPATRIALRMWSIAALLASVMVGIAVIVPWVTPD